MNYKKQDKTMDDINNTTFQLIKRDRTEIDKCALDCNRPFFLPINNDAYCVEDCKHYLKDKQINRKNQNDIRQFT